MFRMLFSSRCNWGKQDYVFVSNISTIMYRRFFYTYIIKRHSIWNIGVSWKDTCSVVPWFFCYNYISKQKFISKKILLKNRIVFHFVERNWLIFPSVYITQVAKIQRKLQVVPSPIWEKKITFILVFDTLFITLYFHFKVHCAYKLYA